VAPAPRIPTAVRKRLVSFQSACAQESRPSTHGGSPIAPNYVKLLTFGLPAATLGLVGKAYTVEAGIQRFLDHLRVERGLSGEHPVGVRQPISVASRGSSLDAAVKGSASSTFARLTCWLTSTIW